MSLVDYIRRDKYVKLFITCISALYAWINYKYYLYFLSDGPFHLGAIREIARQIPPLSPILKIESSPDVHYNISVLLQGIIYKLTNSISAAVIISGALFVGLFLFYINKIASIYTKNSNERILSLIISISLWGPFLIIWAGSFSLLGIMINGFYSQTLGYVFLLSALYYATKAENDKKHHITTTICMSLCIIQHTLSGAAVIYLYFLLIVERISNRRAINIAEILVIPASILLYTLWPLYNTTNILKIAYHSSLKLSLFGLIIGIFTGAIYLNRGRFSPAKNTNKINKKTTTRNRISASYFAILLITTHIIILFAVILYDKIPTQYIRHFPSKILLSPLEFKTFSPLKSLVFLAPGLLIGLFANENRQGQKSFFLRAWFFSLFFLSIIGHGLHIAIFWRLLFFSLIPLSILTGSFLYNTENNLIKWIAGTIIFVLFFWNSLCLSMFCNPGIHNELIFIAKSIPEDMPVISDPMTSYQLSGICDKKVVTNFAGHWSLSFDQKFKNERKQDITTFFSKETKNFQRISIINKYNIKYILISIESYNIDGVSYTYDKKIDSELIKISNIIKTTKKYRLYEKRTMGQVSL